MKKIILLIICLLLLCQCQSKETNQIEIKDHIFVEQEFKDSWLETCQDGRTYLQLTLDGGYFYQTDERYLTKFYQDGGFIELYNYSLKKDDMYICGEFIPDKKILLVHPNLEHISCEGVLAHELGHYFDYIYQFSKTKKFLNLYQEYQEKDLFEDKKERNKSEFFAELFKEYTAHHSLNFNKNIEKYMNEICQKILEKE